MLYLKIIGQMNTIQGALLSAIALIVLGISLLSKWIWRTIQQKWEQDKELYQLKIHYTAVETELKTLGHVREEIMEAWKMKGLGMGILETLEKFGEMERYAQANKTMSDNAENYRSQWKIVNGQNGELLQKNEELHKQLSELQSMRFQLEDDKKRLKLMIKGGSQTEQSIPFDKQRKVKRPTDEANPKAVLNPSQTHPKAVPNLSETRPEDVPKLSQTHPGRVQDGNIRDFLPDFKLKNNHPAYKIIPEDDMSRIYIMDRITDELIKEVVPGMLEKGKTLQIAKSLYLIWCELPGCNTLKLTQAPNARACSREHMKLIEKAQNRKNAQGL